MSYFHSLGRILLSSPKIWRLPRILKFSSQSAIQESVKHLANSNVLGYHVKQVEEIVELNLTAVHLEHIQTGAEHLHLSCNDPNNFFSVTMKTLPPNDSGVPHILEHLALCGSKRYPCRDPFFNMLNRSLATFMNAFTGPDFTSFVFSSQNQQDFENLLSLYLDAVFYPNLTEKDFRQEGWRLEHQNIHNKDSPIIFKGVVFNEMKGCLADPSTFYAEKLLNHMFATNAYQYIYGGDPLCIPNLSWEELKKYHSILYHPSNSRFLTYGNMPLEPLLEEIESQVLCNFQKISFDNEIFNVVPEEKEVNIHCRFNPMASKTDKQTVISESFLLNETKNTYENFALNIMGTLLVDGPNSPLYQNLLQSGIGSDYSPYTGFIGYLKQSMFSVGLREISKEDIEQVKSIIRSTILEASKSGFTKTRIDGILHSLELGMKHRTSNFGLKCCLGANTVWNHGGNPIKSFQINDHIQWLLGQLKPGNEFFQEIIHKYLVSNGKKLTLIMSPLANFEAEEQEKEKKMLESKLQQLSDSEKSRIYQEGLDLAAHQTNSDTSCLPILQIEDIKKTIEPTPLQFTLKNDIPVQFCEQPTNELVYFKAAVDISNMSPEELIQLPIFCTILTQMGAGSRDYKKFDEDSQLTCSDMSVSFSIIEDPTDLTTFSQKVVVSSYCLERNVDDMFSLWTDIFNNVHFNDVERFSQLIRQIAAESAEAIIHDGHNYAIRRAASHLTMPASIKEQTGGFTQVMHLQKIAEKDDHKELLNKMKILFDMLFKNLNKDRLKCSINATPEFMPKALESLDVSFLKNLSYSTNSKSAHMNNVNFKEHEHSKSHIVFPAPLNFIGQSILTVPYCHKDFASLKVVSKLLSSKFLHNEIREKGGAYGGGADLKREGHFIFYSYRDPNFEKTIDSFQNSIQWILDSNFTEQDITEAKLRIFSEMDAPVTPGSKGSSFFLSGISDEMRNNLRSAIFSCKNENLITVTNKYLKNSQKIGLAVLGPENEKTSAPDSGWILTST